MLNQNKRRTEKVAKPKKASKPTTCREAEQMLKAAGFIRVDYSGTGRDGRHKMFANEEGMQIGLPHGNSGKTISPKVADKVMQAAGHKELSHTKPVFMTQVRVSGSGKPPKRRK